MGALEQICPACRAKLRLRDADPQCELSCPECATPLAWKGTPPRLRLVVRDSSLAPGIVNGEMLPEATDATWSAEQVPLEGDRPVDTAVRGEPVSRSRGTAGRRDPQPTSDGQSSRVVAEPPAIQPNTAIERSAGPATPATRTDQPNADKRRPDPVRPALGKSKQGGKSRPGLAVLPQGDSSASVGSSSPLRGHSETEAPAPEPFSPLRESPGSRRRAKGLSAATVAWGSAAMLGMVGLGIVLAVSQPSRTPARKNVVAAKDRKPGESIAGSAAPFGKTTTRAKPASTDDGADSSGETGAGTVASLDRRLGEQFERFGERLLEMARRDEELPVGARPSTRLKGEERFSWIATLYASVADAPAFNGELSWRDPANDRFVRRRLAELLNPAIPRLTGEDGYPATHFVGIAGVGPDAALLPADHPRAGLFGENRRVRWNDVSDGRSQTMMLAGVTDRLGAWARSGSATARSFTQTPYVNGPDSFGTGQNDRMLVLMADGSVRTIAASTPAHIVERMAAMADGLSLDNTTPPKPAPLDVAVKPVNPTIPFVSPLDEEPLHPQFAEDDPTPAVVVRTVAQIEQALELRLGFEQSKPASRKELLLQLADLAGAKLLVETTTLGPLAGALSAKITLRGDNESVRNLFDKALHETHLAWRVEPGRIRIFAETP